MWEFFIAVSVHIGALVGYDFNEVHPHVRYTTEDSYIAGVYYNSERDISVYGGYDFGNVELGFVTGYNSTVLPFVRLTYEGFYATPVLYGDDNDVGLVIGYELKL